MKKSIQITINKNCFECNSINQLNLILGAFENTEFIECSISRHGNASILLIMNLTSAMAFLSF